jgi:Outer membrane lipoprotein carrier protein LolA-like
MLRDSGGVSGEGAARAVTRSFIAAIAIASLASICFAEPIAPSLTSGQSLHGRFEQTRNLKGISAKLKSSGSFVLVPDQGLVWRIEQPIQSTTVITKEGVQEIINGNDVQRIEAARVPLISHFYDMLGGALMGDWSAMRHDFAVKTTGDHRAWQTVLTPLHSDDPITGALSSVVITGGAMVDQVDIRRANGDSEQLTFLEQKISTAPISTDDARLLSGKP